MPKITFANKQNFSNNFSSADSNKIITAENINEIKNVVNQLDSTITSLQSEISSLRSRSYRISTRYAKLVDNKIITVTPYNNRIKSGGNYASINFNAPAFDDGESIDCYILTLTPTLRGEAPTQNPSLISSDPAFGGWATNKTMRFYFFEKNSSEIIAEDVQQTQNQTVVASTSSDHTLLNVLVNPEGSGSFVVNAELVKIYNADILTNQITFKADVYAKISKVEVN